MHPGGSTWVYVKTDRQRERDRQTDRHELHKTTPRCLRKKHPSQQHSSWRRCPPIAPATMLTIQRPTLLDRNGCLFRTRPNTQQLHAQLCKRGQGVVEHKAFCEHGCFFRKHRYFSLTRTSSYIGHFAPRVAPKRANREFTVE